MAKACAYLCRQCCFIDDVSEFGEKKRFFLDKCQSTLTKHDGHAVLFAVAELLVITAVLFIHKHSDYNCY